MSAHGAAETRTRAVPLLAPQYGLLKRPAAALAGALLLAAAMVGISRHYRIEQDARLADTRLRHDKAFEKLVSSEREREEIRLYQPRFVSLQDEGLVGMENRLAWIEALRQSQAARKLLSVTYDIEPQQPVTLSGPIALGDYQLRASRMELHAGLLHEMELFNLLADLRHAGKFTVQDCRMKRTEAAADSAQAPHLLADCTLVWVTLEPVGRSAP